VSFKSREKKRRYKRAVERSKRIRSEETAGRWFLTLARKNCVCACCPSRIGAGGEIVYRHKPREVRCVRCAERLEDSRGFRPSMRWEKARRKQQVVGPPRRKKKWRSDAPDHRVPGSFGTGKRR
jgi:hypothetical protein